MALSLNNNGHINIAMTEADLETMPRLNDDGIGDHGIPRTAIHENAGKDIQMSMNDVGNNSEPSTPVTITFHNICKVISVPGKMMDPKSKEKTIQRALLENISGRLPSGEVAALMGPSGSGKTTLLNVLAGRNLDGVSGNIWLNNQLYEKNMRRKFAYVLQEDIFFDELTVKQQFIYTALLRLPRTFTKKDKLKQVEKVIGQLRLEKCSNVPIKLISGGEKKRVNIGTELLTNPSVIFLDEPTSGLDSTSATLLMSVLRELAATGKTIVTSIHQPSSHIFQSFDQLILLADGKTVFMGEPQNATHYFAMIGYESPSQYNPADFIMDLVNQDMAIREELKEAYIQNKYVISKDQGNNESEQSRETTLIGARKYLIGEPNGNGFESINDKSIKAKANDDESKWPIGFFAQTCILFSRNWLLTSKAQFSKLNCIQALCMSILYGILWFRMKLREDTLNDRSSFIFFMMIFWPFEICFQGILSIPSERAVINKERASGSFRLSAYYMAKCLSETPLKLVLPAISFTVSYWMANLSPNFPIFLGVLVFLLIVILVAESFGVLLGALFQNVSEAWITGNVVLIAGLLTGGYFIENMPYWLQVWTKWLSFYKYAYDACIRLVFMSGHRYQCVNGKYIDICKTNTNGTFSSAEALEYFDVDLSIGLNFLVLFGIFIAFRLGAYICLRFIKHNDGRS